MATIDVDGTSLEVVERGSGDPLVLVHGAFSDWRCWQAQIEELSADFRVIAYSRRWHHPNQALGDGERPDFDRHVTDVLGVLDALAIDSAHLAGISQGGLIALWAAYRHPVRFRRLILSEPAVLSLFVSNQPRPGEVFKLLFTRPAAGFAFVKMGAKGIGPALKAFKAAQWAEGMQHFIRMGIGPAYFERLSEERLEQMRINARPFGEFSLGEGAPRMRREDLADFAVPTLVTHGQDSDAFMKLVCKTLVDAMPDARLAQIPDASHLHNEDNPAAFNAAVRRFLGASTSTAEAA